MRPESPRLTPGLLVVLAVIAAVGPLATDMYLPAFTDIATDLGSNPSSVQLTLTTFMLGLGIGQLFLGPLSDRWGRRGVLIIALAVFAASSIAMTFTPNVEIFIALRTVQGLSGAAGIVLSRAVIADTEKGSAAVRAFSLLAMMVAIAPLIAPLAGGVISEFWGWRGVLAVVAAVTVLMFALACLFVHESLPRDQRHVGGISRTLANFARLIRDRNFLLLMVVVGMAFGTLLAYISASPFVAQVMLGMSPTQFSLAFAVGALSMVAANLLNARFAGRASPIRMLLIGSGLVLLAAVAMTVFATTGTLTAAGFIPSAFVLSGGVALVMANTSAIALGLADFARGSGSALLGASQFLGGSIVSPIVGAWGEHTALPMALTMLTTSAIAIVCVLVVLRSRRV
ncbi:multidrug effflux MFS transporter [Leucobacter rhizosphaerae]|uniref:Multidrug effflux MFS transporter n=1 Tax=Leucobacter rhizosphaerae TaxID=2932245 RepID=A0ABY4FV63_9MICO|nr:multidrug effflux MFS transporter [Leucobacter rhizosphaerae]UOQ60157.1 multidrug effflux MFS transporter [Leucobacter rhizosphaerae]